jgi:polysaccharide export outer membrane protein
MIRRALIPILPLAVTALALSACSGGGPSGVNATNVSAASVVKAQQSETDVASADYVIGAGDSLSVFVYRNPDLSEADVAVRPDGRTSIPLIEDITAAGRTPTQLARDIEARLKQYIKDPVVTVIIRRFVGAPNRQIRVIGEATDPVAIPYRERLSLLDVMIATKGLTKYAAGNRAVIIRSESAGRQEIIHVKLDNLLNDGDMTQNVAMQPGDTLIIPQSWF